MLLMQTTRTGPHHLSYSQMSPEFQRPRWKLGGPGREVDEQENYSPTEPYAYQTDASEKDFSVNVFEYIEPAIDGPPSPERLRQLTTEMKRASHLQRRAPVIQGPRVGPSASSSVAPFAPDYHPWEQPNDYYFLNRRPSQRSTGSSTPSRERPESIFGKNIFHRKGRLTRDSSTHSSSAASSVSGDLTGEGITGLKDALKPMFSRRKTSRDETAVQRKLQISTPFNFQHVSHTDKNNFDDRPGSSLDLPCEVHGTRMPGPASASRGLKGVEISDPYFSNVTASATGIQSPDTLQTFQQFSRPNLVPRHTAPTFGVRRLLKQAKSQDHFLTSPTRQSIVSPTVAPDVTPPLPPIPLRISSRQSILSDAASASPAVAVGPLWSAPLERPMTSAGFRKPRPFSPFGREESPMAPSFRSDGAGDDELSLHRESARMSPSPSPSPADLRPSAASPSTPTYEKALPDVPEEEEYHVSTQKARASVVSHASLRGSHSVPMLRSSLRPTSSGSDTLGPHDAMTGRRVTTNKNAEPGTGRSEVVSSRESWEDDIDYAYEHEVEANCDYQWGRSSIDASRQTNRQPNPAVADDNGLANESQSEPSSAVAPAASGGKRGQVLAPSPTNPPSPVKAREATTSVYSQHPLHHHQQPVMVNNFSYSRLSVKRHARSNSNASSYKESPGFTVSPSLLVPIDYREYMASLSDEPETPSLEPQHKPYHHQRYPSHDMGTQRGIGAPLRSFERRSSTSTTTESIADSRSDSTGERHASANSACTCLTGPTASSTSLNKLAEFDFEELKQQHQPVQEPAQQTTPNATTAKLVEANQERNTADELGAYNATHSPDADIVPELTQLSFIPPRGKSLHKTHASESMATATRPDVPHMKSFEARTRRVRSRTTSLSQAPPVGQYALFPRGQVRATGDRI